MAHSSFDGRPGSTVLHYEVNVAPKLLFPAPLVERIIRADLPVNLRANFFGPQLERGITHLPKLPQESWSRQTNIKNIVCHCNGRLYIGSTKFGKGVGKFKGWALCASGVERADKMG
jgi:hypothetical protein